MIRSADPEGARKIERRLTRGISTFTDAAAFLPTDANSLTSGATEVTATGDDAADIASLLGSISDGVPSRPVLVLGAAAARSMVFSGNQAFRDVALLGPGSLGGIPTFTTPAGALAGYAIAVDADGVLKYDAGINLDRSNAATIELDTAPSGGTLTSLFQKNLTGIRAIRFVAWAKRSDATAFVNLV